MVLVRVTEIADLIASSYWPRQDIYPGGNIAMHLDREGPFAPDKARFYACEIVSFSMWF